MKRLKIMTAMTTIVIFSSLLMSCSGGGSSQGDVFALSSKAGNSDSGRGPNDRDSDGDDANPGHSDNQGRDESNGNDPDNLDNRGRDGDDGDHAGGSNDTTDIPVSTAVNSQQYSTVAFEPGQGKFLVVWNDLRNRNDFDYHGWAVYGQLVNSSGSFQGNNFTISPLGVEYRTPPIVAHDAATGHSLVVWGTTGGNILGQMINGDGTFFGNVIPIAASSTYEGVPALVFDPIQGRFLVVWLALNNEYPIYGQLVSREGALEGSPFLISAVSSGKLELHAAAATDIARFLVVWRDYRGVDIYSIRGQMVNSDGTLYGDEINIADSLGAQISPALAYDSVNRCFLVTWSDDRQFGGAYYEIYGQLVAGDGVLIGSNFFISTYGGYPHTVAFDPSSTKHFLTFSKSGKRIHGQYIAADGLPLDEAVPLSDLEGIQGSPHLAYDSSSTRFLVTWTDHRNGSRDIYGHTTSFTVSPDPCDGQDGQNAPGCLECETVAGGLVDEACPVDVSYTGHGAYVDCVTKAVNELRRAGQISGSCAIKLVDPRARSPVGNPS